MEVAEARGPRTFFLAAISRRRRRPILGEELLLPLAEAGRAGFGAMCWFTKHKKIEPNGKQWIKWTIIMSIAFVYLFDCFNLVIN